LVKEAQILDKSSPPFLVGFVMHTFKVKRFGATKQYMGQVRVPPPTPTPKKEKEIHILSLILAPLVAPIVFL
jgi:hypothetical protein